MALVDWKKEVEVSSGTDADQDLLLEVLSLDRHATETRWSGDVKFARKKGRAPYPTQVIIRGNIAWTPVVLTIGNHDQTISMQHWYPDQQRDARITIGGGICPTPDEMHLIALMIQEGRQVLANARKKFQRDDAAKRA